MQLVAYGAQDIYLTGNPQITFFKVVYRRHTNFAMESVEQTLNGSVGFGNKVTSTISRNGDLVHKMYLELSASTTTHDDTGPNPGSALINEVEVEIGGQRIDKHYGHWMEVWAELSQVNPTGHSGTQAAATSGVRNSGTLFQNSTGMGGVSGQAVTITDIVRMNVPLQFWFCRNPGLALPLIALQYHEVKIITTFAASTAVFDETNGTHSLTAKLWADYIYLDTDERRRFAQVSHEYLIEQLQFQSFGNVTSCDLTFNHPVKELVWCGTPGSVAANDIDGPSTPKTLTEGTTFQLKLNGHDRFAARTRDYFTRVQVSDYHSGYGGIFLTSSVCAKGDAQRSKDSIAVYSFALKPEEHQPSGTCNFSRIDNALLELSAGNSDGLNVYAVNYNVLRIMSGMGGLAYSN